MAQLLYDRDSTGKHLNAGRRHMRLCRRHNQAHLADQINPQYESLLESEKKTKIQAELREDAYDDMRLADDALDNTVRNSFSVTQMYDRQNPGQPVIRQLFPDGKFGDIVWAPLMKEPDLVERLAIRFEALGETHELYPQAGILRAQVAESRTAIDSYKDAVRNEKLAEADEEIAKAALRRQYEANYLTARMNVGKDLAEKLYPSLSAKPPVVQEEQEAA